MTDWLNEIEEHSKKFRDEFITPEQEAGGLQYIDEMDNERMTRVLRELASELLRLKKMHKHTSHIFYELSDDAKELLK